MFIYDNIVWEKSAGKEHLWIGEHCDFYGKDDNLHVADLAKANKVGDEDTINERLAEIEKARNDSSVTNYTVRLADNQSKLRGYGGGLAIVGEFANSGSSLFFPHRDLGAPGDRLIWDVCAGRTVQRYESPNWLHRMLVEGLEEITFVHHDELIVPYIKGLDTEVLTVSEASDIVYNNAMVLDLDPTIHIDPHTFFGVPMTYTPPRNSTVIHQKLEDGSEIEFKAGWGVEAKYSGLELMAYGVINFVYPLGDLRVYDSEEFAPGKVCHREIHMINPDNGAIVVYKDGEVVNPLSDIATEYDRRDFKRTNHNPNFDQPWQVPIPPYSASIKADLLTRQEAWPFPSNISALKDIEFRG